MLRPEIDSGERPNACGPAGWHRHCAEVPQAEVRDAVDHETAVFGL
jgi:hypothetical protein